MCRSVPQIAVFSTLISTSLGPGEGTGTSSIQMPLAGSRLTSAFIVRPMWMPVGKYGCGGLYGPCTLRPGGTRSGAGHDHGHGGCTGGMDKLGNPLVPGPDCMRMRSLSPAIVLPFAAAAPAAAAEGRWLPSQLPSIAGQMRAAGYRGDPGALADLTAAPMNAVVRVGGGTGAFVSGEGLVLTNHHVAFGVIQYNSGKGRDGVERDLIRDGYIAADRAAELPASPDFRVLVTTGFERITDRVLAAARGRTGRAYYDAVDAAGKAAVAECEAEPGYRCSVATMDYGRDFYLVRQLELRDIRLVYAPPSAIGRYGDEIDNFMWPRHSGDFTLLRA